MKIAIINAETLPNSVVEKFGSYGDMFVALLQLYDKEFHFDQYYADQRKLPTDIKSYDGFIVTGSRHNAYDSEVWIVELKEFIRDVDHARKQCLGICFGHQVIAEALGGKVERSNKGWGIGVGIFRLKDPPAWINTTQHEFNILISHQDQVISLPPQAHCMATNQFCPNGGFTISNHIFCLQGHPEFSKDYIQALIDKRREIIGEERLMLALENLKQLQIEAALGQWIYNFLSLKNPHLPPI